MKDVFLLGAEDPRKALGPLRPAQLLCFAPGLEVWESLIIRLIKETCSNSQILKVPPPFLSWDTYSFQRWDKDIPWGENYFSPCSCGPIQTESHPDETPWELCIQGHIKPWVVNVQGHWKQGLSCPQSCNITLWGATTSSCVNLGSLLYLGCVSVSSSIEWGSC